MAELLGIAAEKCDVSCRGCRDKLESLGSVVVGSGTLRGESWRLDIHSCLGPVDQDKDENQDFAVGWLSHERDSLIAWAVAMADGVTSSCYSAAGAELACWAGLAAVVGDDSAGEDRGWHAMDAAGKAIGDMTDLIAADAGSYAPSGEFASTWKYALRKGLLLQTTLTLAWLQAGRLCVAIVGDGGAIVDHGREPKQNTEVLTEADLTTNRVHAMGPGNREVVELDCWAEMPFDGKQRVALFTDGISRGLSSARSPLFHQLDEVRNQVGDGNAAEFLVQRWIDTAAKSFEDNLTLALVSVTGQARERTD